MTKHTESLSPRFHPAANIFPLMGEVDLKNLAADIQKNDLLNPIILHSDGSVLDGRNRLLACNLIGVKPRFVTWDEQGSPMDFVVSQNLHRRHLSSTQCAMVAAKIANFSHGGDRSKGKIYPLLSREEAGKKVGVSKKSVDKAAKVMSTGVPELVEAVENDMVSVSTAAALADLPSDLLRETLAGGKEKITEEIANLKHAKTTATLKSKRSMITPPMRWTPEEADEEFEGAILDLIIVEPNLDMYLTQIKNLATQAGGLLKPDGILVCITDRKHLADMVSAFSEARPYMTASVMLCDEGIKSERTWSPILFFSNDDVEFPPIMDVVHSSEAVCPVIKYFDRPGVAVWVPSLGPGYPAMYKSEKNIEEAPSNERHDLSTDLVSVEL